MNSINSGAHLGFETKLWAAADQLRSNSNYASNEYFMPVMGLIFLRHAYSRYLAVKDEIEANLPSRGGKTRAITKKDFSQKSAIFLKKEAQYDYLVSLPKDTDLAKAIYDAMESIESDYESLKGILPKSEYHELNDEVLANVMRTLNPEELKTASGDIFGRIYEYFLTQFADLKAHDNGEFFTPVSLVSLIANVLEPKNGTILDPACGSGGMFVQSAHFVERLHQNPTEKLTFYGIEKNQTTIRLAKMNLAVHGLEGDIKKEITYYQDPHELFGKSDFVMANPPFNVDEVDAEKIEEDPRLPFGLPGVNKAGKVSNGNYLWISYFYSYLNEKGRAGFVMSSQASSAGGGEATVRQKLVETGSVEVMIAIRSNFFYTRTVPCELWFLNRAKPDEYKNKVLMIDARNVYRKVTRKIYDFSPEQLQNILSIVWLHRNQPERFHDLVVSYLTTMLNEAQSCFEEQSTNGSELKPLPDFTDSVKSLLDQIDPFLKSRNGDDAHTEPLQQLQDALKLFNKELSAFEKTIHKHVEKWDKKPSTNAQLNQAVSSFEPIAETSRDLIKQTDLLYKLACRLIEVCETELNAKENDEWSRTTITRARKAADEARQYAVEQLKQVRYYWKQAHWLVERFPKGEYSDVEGLVKLVDVSEIEENDWSLTPGRYVGVAPEEEDENFDFEETIRNIHVELDDLNAEAVQLAATIKKNFEELGI